MVNQRLNQLDVNQKLMQSPDVFVSEIDEEMVMANFATNKYYGLDAVSTHIWKLLAQPHTIGELCEHLLPRFEVDAATCQQDVAELLAQLVDAQLVQAMA